jgi:hypothetical protein
MLGNLDCLHTVLHMVLADCEGVVELWARRIVGVNSGY